MPQPLSTPQRIGRIGAVAAPIGAAVLFVSTLLHPLGADPNNARPAVAEYASDPFYVWSHIGRFVGFTRLGMTLVALAIPRGCDPSKRPLPLLAWADRPAGWRGNDRRRGGTSVYGFSGLAMTISMAASSVLLVWIVLAGILLGRLAFRLARSGHTVRPQSASTEGDTT
jgi:hypothetical protein